jgi:hypothetical protein
MQGAKASCYVIVSLIYIIIIIIIICLNGLFTRYIQRVR